MQHITLFFIVAKQRFLGWNECGQIGFVRKKICFLYRLWLQSHMICSCIFDYLHFPIDFLCLSFMVWTKLCTSGLSSLSSSHCHEDVYPVKLEVRGIMRLLKSVCACVFGWVCVCVALCLFGWHSCGAVFFQVASLLSDWCVLVLLCLYQEVGKEKSTVLPPPEVVLIFIPISCESVQRPLSNSSTLFRYLHDSVNTGDDRKAWGGNFGNILSYYSIPFTMLSPVKLKV